MKPFLHWITGSLLLMASAVTLTAQTNVFPLQTPGASVRPVAPAAVARPGRALLLNLGDDQFLPFVWIGPLKMWVGKFEVTNGQYNRFDMGHESQPYYGLLLNGPDQPVVGVSWEDANNYGDWLTRTFAVQIPPGYGFRLPTEWEWQAFASCGARRRYPWGNTWPPPDTFNYRGTEGAGFLYTLFQRESCISGHDDGIIATCPVTRSGANAWGLFGVGGNVWEWCRNWHDEQQITRALRGAGWNNDEPDIMAIANRSDALPTRSNAMIGFRVVLAPEAAAP